MFTAVLNTRLTKYTEEYDAIEACQAGFRKHFSTIDNLFIIQSLIDILKVQKRKLYCAFIDFKQASDTVWRKGLWHKLINTNINGKCFRVIQNMYLNIKSRIITAEGTSAFFPCQIGVRQGESLSPLLFSIYLNDLSNHLRLNGAPGITCEYADDDILIYLKSFISLFADDTVLFSNNKDDLQITLNSFEQYCDTWHLTVNTNKTKIIVFTGGKIQKV
ncbi:MAG: reverse transcriptase family protein [Candidatus Thiodiazotropha endolucinida]|nr:reverse transcriptase family protein [Candidatus Thiodiazotropha taylori]MCW4263813.1 reverse transcriptase family protein [Candidatus Thiodiazotropha endolucinida]